MVLTQASADNQQKPTKYPDTLRQQESMEQNFKFFSLKENSEDRKQPGNNYMWKISGLERKTYEEEKRKQMQENYFNLLSQNKKSSQDHVSFLKEPLPKQIFGLWVHLEE